MSLDRSTVKEFADYLNGSDEGELASLSLIGTATVDGSGNISVLLDGCDTATPVTSVLSGSGDNASVSNGDRVLVLLQNRTATVIGNYTTDAAQAAHDRADEAYDKAEEGGEQTIVEWCIDSNSSSPSNANVYPANNWSMVMSLPTNTSQYLWRRIVIVTGDTGTVQEGSVQKATTMDGLYVFMNQAMTGGATVIDGGSINISNAIYTGRHTTLLSSNDGAYLGSNGISYVKTSGGDTFGIVVSEPQSSYNNLVFGAGYYQNGSWDYTVSIHQDGSFGADEIIGNTIKGGTVTANSLSSDRSISAGSNISADGYVKSGDGYCMSYAINDFGRIMDWGTVNITVSGTSVTTADITFNHTFSSAPYVFCTANPSTTMRVGASAAYVTTTGCRICAFGNVSQVAGSTPVRWLAIGEA